MPKRTDIEKILIIGAGPIIISQACEFDYSGTQACKALKEEGYSVVLINSNPATIMTDPEFADATYIEPVIPEAVEAVIEKERPDAILPTLGGQTGLNTAVAVAQRGVLEKYNVEMIGATLEAIQKAEDRDSFRKAMRNIGLRIPESGIARSMDDAFKIASKIKYPLIVRPSFTLGGTGGGVAKNEKDLQEMVEAGLDASIISQVMLEESVVGWKEYELELMRDRKDNAVIVCSIENMDPMGVHTGESITVAPIQTLSDKEYQTMRDASIAIMREIGVDTGGSNVQFAVNPENGDMVVVEMNPRVSRSSALASKATGFPIAKIAAKLAVGFTLDEIPNDITGETIAAFEPTLDYCVVKIPRWTFEKFPETKDELTTSMKSVGETMAIGRTFKEALQKGLRSLEIQRYGLGADGADRTEVSRQEIIDKLTIANSERIFYLRYALQKGFSIEEIYQYTGIDPWFLDQINKIIKVEETLTANRDNLTPELLLTAKREGFSDVQLAQITGTTEEAIRQKRYDLNMRPVYKLVDTCAAEFRAATPYYYSTYEQENEARVTDRKKIVILGGGPNRIGQGIEFDYCCVHASFALREEGVESIMVNSNPETVSTDYDTSDQLFFEPLTTEDVLHIIETQKCDGVIVQFGGQTPLNISDDLNRVGVNIIGTHPESIARTEDRKLFAAMLNKLGLIQPPNDTATDVDGALAIAERIGYPVIVRPSFVLGGRAMKIVYTKEELVNFARHAIKASPKYPILVDKFLEDAVELDVDAISDKTGETVIGGIMEHIEEAGIHSGDSACVLPPQSISPEILENIIDATKAMARELNVVGLMNVQYAVKDDTIYIIEVNPRASRTIPFVSKATGVPLAKAAAKVMLGRTLKELNISDTAKNTAHVSVKESVFPFNRFPDVDTLLGPEMKSTGEVMGIDDHFGAAFAKAQLGAGQKLPVEGTIFISVKDSDKQAAAAIGAKFVEMGFSIIATAGTARFFDEKNIANHPIHKVSEGHPHIVDAIINNQVGLVINTGTGMGSQVKRDGYMIRRAALKCGVPYATTIAGGMAMCKGIAELKKRNIAVKAIQAYHRQG
ncbi:MAG: carbamoyl-phosphate synthase large subunit [Thermodesulfobacteriota bacterium]|nr:carbamoyl-phosphate synthase large subunit [Thermodesulfobacteriota bacterium]